MRSRPIFRKVLYTILVLFLLANIMAAFHAYKFTHFRPGLVKGTRDEWTLTAGEKLQALLFGVSLPRPVSTRPEGPVETIMLKSNRRIECWLIPADSAVGTAIIFHGYGNSKSAMLERAAIFRQLHYNTLLPDFMGSGGSEGNVTTIGFQEAEQVRTCVEAVRGLGESNIVLTGTSMGAAAIMKAMHDAPLPVRKIILECPFGTMLQTVRNRFAIMGVPAFPMANLLVAWGGLLNGFNAFRHNPEDYAGSISCPALLIYGEQDPKVTPEETAAVFAGLAGPKTLVCLPLAGHADYLTGHREDWTAAVDSFLAR